MHVIEQVSGIQFPIDTQHNLLKISNKTSISAARELREKGVASKAKGKGVLGSHSHRGASPPAAVARCSSAESLSSSTSGKKPSKFKFLMTYMFGQCCASAQREHDMQQRLYCLEQWANIESSHDPLALYDEACAAYEDNAASHPDDQSKATVEDEDYIDEDDDDDDNGGDDGDHDDDEDYEDEQSVISRGLPLLALVDKGGVLGFDLIVISQLVTQSL